MHNDYPLAPAKIKVAKEMLLQFNREKFNISIGQAHKLFPSLNNKERYVLHYRNLQLYLNLGLKVTKVHRVLEFDQSPFFKLINNSVFGKTMENLRKRIDIKLMTDEKKLTKLTSKPAYVSSQIFNENLVAAHKIKEMLTLNRPAYVGMCILDLSKVLMYNFHYNYIKKGIQR